MPVQNTIRVNHVINNIVFAIVLWSFAILAGATLPRLVAAMGTAPFFHSSGPTPSAAGSSAGITPVGPADNQGDGASASFNWAGYAAGGSFSGVSGSWDVPQVSASGNSISSDATWIGLGGVQTTDLIQAGTESTVENGNVVYHAWYELLPSAMMFVPLTVNAGDTISTSIIENTPGTWQVTITNVTTSKSYQASVNYDSTLGSAEWIEERPSLASGGLVPLSNFGSVVWHSASVLQNGQWVTASSVNAQPISMLSRSGQTVAAPTALADNSGFTVAQSSVQPVTGSSEPTQSLAVATGRTHRLSVGPWSITIPMVDDQVPSVGQNTSASVTGNDSSYSSGSSHGAYYFYINGKLVEQKQW